MQTARLVHYKRNAYVRYQWEDSGEHYLEMRIAHQELTGDILLTVVDFAEEDERDGCKELWDTLIEKLKRAIGCPKNDKFVPSYSVPGIRREIIVSSRPFLSRTTKDTDTE